jgi:hypothetical protein
MERVMRSYSPDQLSLKLRQTNTRLRSWLEDLIPDLTQKEMLPPPPASQLIANLLSELLQAGQCLRSDGPQPRSAELEAEIAQYRRNVERLRDLLPAIHRCLLSERARLEAERKRVELALEWAQSSRQTIAR